MFVACQLPRAASPIRRTLLPSTDCIYISISTTIRNQGRVTGLSCRLHNLGRAGRHKQVNPPFGRKLAQRRL